MITEEEVVSLGGVPLNTGYEYQFDSWDYLLNTRTSTFWFINDGFGEPELIADGINSIDQLIKILESLNLID